jgi:hypothetical protein
VGLFEQPVQGEDSVEVDGLEAGHRRAMIPYLNSTNAIYSFFA